MGYTALAVTIAVPLCARRGLSPARLGLELRARGGRPSLGVMIRVAGCAVAALIAGALLAGAVSAASYPFGATATPNLGVQVVDGLLAGPPEETVALAFVVVTLLQARRPTWEIVVAAVVLRATFHLYYGLGVIGIVVWMPVFVWLFLRTGQRRHDTSAATSVTTQRTSSAIPTAVQR